MVPKPPAVPYRPLPWRTLVLLAVTATLLRLGLALSYRTHTFHYPDLPRCPDELTLLTTGAACIDPDQYLRLGQSIACRHRFWLDDRPHTFRTPGYPLLIAAVGSNIPLLVVLQSIFGGIGVLLLGVTGCRLAGRLAGTTAAALLTVDVSGLLHAGMVMSEPLFSLLLVAGLALYLSRHRHAAALLFGAAVLVRPVGAILLLPFSLHLIAERRWKTLVVFVLVFSLAPAGWIARNFWHYRYFGLATASSYNNFNSAIRLVASASNQDYQNLRDSIAAEVVTAVPPDNPLALAAELDRRALAITINRPLRSLSRWALAIPRLLFSLKSDDIFLRLTSDRAGTSRVRNRLPPALTSGSDLLFWLAAGWELLSLAGALVLAGIALLRARERLVAWLLAGVGFALIAAASPLIDGRYRDPALPMLYLLAGIGLATLSRPAAMTGATHPRSPVA